MNAFLFSNNIVINNVHVIICTCAGRDAKYHNIIFKKYKKNAFSRQTDYTRTVPRRESKIRDILCMLRCGFHVVAHTIFYNDFSHRPCNRLRRIIVRKTFSWWKNAHHNIYFSQSSYRIRLYLPR